MQVERCEPCKGSGVFKGIFHKGDCAACNGGGVVSAETHAALEYPELVAYLRDALKRAQVRPVGWGSAADYEGMRNRRGIGGGNWTGD